MMDDVIQYFLNESRGILAEMTGLLHEMDGKPKEIHMLENYGQLMDRVMGGAKTLEMQYQSPLLSYITSYSELCKTISYKGSQLKGNPEFGIVIVAFLLDATEMLEELINGLGSEEQYQVKDLLTKTFLSRLQLIGEGFDKNMRGTLPSERDTAAQNEIDKFLNSFNI